MVKKVKSLMCTKDSYATVLNNVTEDTYITDTKKSIVTEDSKDTDNDAA